MSLPRFRFGLLGIAAAAAVSGACGDPLALGPARFENRVDTLTLFAIQGTAIQLESGYDVVNRRPARIDRAQPFDFAVDIDSTGRALALPTGALGLSRDPGLVPQTVAFDSIVTAPLEGFVVDSGIALAEGDIFVARSRNTSEQCALLGSLPRYGKFRVLAIDLAARHVTFEALVNANCGFRGLQPGFPES